MIKQSRKYAPDPETLALRAELQAAQSELALAYRQFDQATAPELVELGQAAAAAGQNWQTWSAADPDAVNSIIAKYV